MPMTDIIILQVGELLPGEFETLYSMLSEYRKDRVDMLIYPEYKLVSMYTELLIRYVAALRLGKEFKAIHIAHQENGKPYIAGCSDFHFSISHSKNMIAFAVSDSETGIDIEVGGHEDERIVDRFFTEDEKARYYEAHNHDQTFFEIWTAKEAYIKMYGGVLADMRCMPSVLKTEGISTWMIEDAIVSLCCKHTEDSSDYSVMEADFRMLTDNIIKKKSMICWDSLC